MISEGTANDWGASGSKGQRNGTEFCIYMLEYCLYLTIIVGVLLGDPENHATYNVRSDVT